MDNIKKFLSHNPKYNRYKKPLEAANVCDSARSVAEGRYDVISFRAGLLTLSVTSAAAAANLSLDSEKLKKEINTKIGEEMVKKLRFKIV